MSTDEFTILSPDDFVVIEGLPFADGPTRWHVNEHFEVHAMDEEGSIDPMGLFDDVEMDHSDDARHGLIFQRANADMEWLGVVVADGEFETQFFAQGMFSGDPEVFDAELEITDHVEELEDLDNVD